MINGLIVNDLNNIWIVLNPHYIHILQYHNIYYILHATTYYILTTYHIPYFSMSIIDNNFVVVG